MSSPSNAPVLMLSVAQMFLWKSAQIAMFLMQKESTDFNEVLHLEICRLATALHPDDDFHILWIYGMENFHILSEKKCSLVLINRVC